MKKLLIVIIILFFFQNTIYAEDEVIWDYRNDEFIKELLKDNPNASDAAKQKLLDEELSKNLGIDLIYTDLAECLKIALDNNYTMKQKERSKEQAYWEYKNANAQFLPDFSYQYTMQYIDGKFLVGGVLLDRFDELPIQNIFQLEWGGVQQGKLFFLNKQRKSLLKASRSTVDYTRDEIILKVTLAYYDLLSQKLQFEVFKSNLLDRLYQYRMVKAKYEAGIESKYYVTRAETEVAGARQNYITAANSLRLTQAKLANLMGVEILDAIYPSEGSIQIRKLVEDKYSIEKLYEIALQSRDDVLAEKLKIDALVAEKNSNYLDFAPKTTSSYARSIVGTPSSGFGPNTTISLGVTFPLGKNLGFGTMTTIKAYKARVESEEYKLTNLIRSVKESILGSYYNSKSAYEKIEAAKSEVRAADESVTIAIAQAKVGIGVFTDVIYAQNKKIQAQEVLIRTTTEYNKAQAQLLFDAGIISLNAVLNGYKPVQINTTQQSQAPKSPASKTKPKSKTKSKP